MGSLARTVLLFVVIYVVINLVSSRGLRLNYHSSTTLPYGRLEIYYSNMWIPFTIAGFNMHAADLACRSLGYSFASRYARVEFLGYSQATAEYSVFNLSCPSHATSFSLCSYTGNSNLSHYNDVGLQCTNSRSSLRLLSSGRLQIFINNTWGTVCADNFGAREARIACGQLGYIGYDSYTSAGYSPNFSGPIWLDNLYLCSEFSMDLRNCTAAVGVNDCEHSEDIILKCHDRKNQGDLRLVSFNYTSKYKTEGRLEIYYTNRGQLTWMPFCESGFNKRAADLACQQLGYSGASRYNTVENLGYDQSLFSNHISSVNCNPHASRLSTGCQFYISSLCSGSSEVAIICTNYNSTGVIIGSVIGSLALILFLFIGIMCCAVIIAFLYYKKRRSHVRMINVVKDLPEENYRMSDLKAKENHSEDTAIPSNVGTVKQDNYHGTYDAVSGIVTQEESAHQNIEDISTSDDKKPLVY